MSKEENIMAILINNAIHLIAEGGFEKAEVEKAQELGVQPVTLGKRILRTETAGLTTLSILMYLLEE